MLGLLLFNVKLVFGICSAGNTLGQEYTESRGKAFPISDSENVASNLSITVVGASGDLAKKKIFPALFALYYEDCLPEVTVFIMSSVFTW